jgi:hypothetical protein
MTRFLSVNFGSDIYLLASDKRRGNRLGVRSNQSDIRSTFDHLWPFKISFGQFLEIFGQLCQNFGQLSKNFGQKTKNFGHLTKQGVRGQARHPTLGRVACA